MTTSEGDCPGNHCHVGIIGAGAAGVLVASRLLDRVGGDDGGGGGGLAVTLIDPAPDTGRGAAYRTGDRRHLLNVVAGRMSADPDRPDDFVRWLGERYPELADPTGYVPRQVYGEYLADHLDAAAARSSGRLRRVHDRVVGIEPAPDGGGLVFALGSGDTLAVDAGVLAVGNLPPDRAWAPPGLCASRRYVADPWAPEALDAVPADGDVLLVGTGLTMVDVAVALAAPGRVLHAVSRHGLLPAEHATAPRPAAAAPPALDGTAGLPALRRAVLAHVSRCVREAGDWRPAVDGLRPLTAALWQGLPAADREEFLREHSRHWEVHRHRMPARCATAVADARAAGRLQIAAAEVTGVVDAGNWLLVRLSDGRTLRVAAVVNCTGARADVRDAGDPLLDALLTAGTARPGPHDLGLDTAPDGRLRAADGGTSAPLWTLGSLRRGTLWETTAIPEIRCQAADIAADIASRVIPATQPVRHRWPTDRYGLRLSTDPVAAGAYDRALDRLLRVECGVAEALAEAVAADPGFAVGHAALALLGHEWGAEVDVAAAMAAARTAADRRADTRERSFVAAVAALVEGTGEAGDAALLRHVEEHPRDALAVSVAVPTIAFGGVTCGERTWRLVEGLRPAYGDDWWYLGQLAFVRQEQERWDEAEALSARSLAEQPASGHAAHARTHVFYETGAHAEGLAWLDGWIAARGPLADHRAHFSWHAALHELALGDTGAVRRRYADQLAPPAVTGARALVDSASLLWRCQMTGSWPGRVPIDPVLEVAPDGWLERPPTPFAALHSAVGLAASGDAAGLARLRRYADGHTGPAFTEVVGPLCTALTAVVEQRWQRAVTLLTALLPVACALGGSAAQRGVLEETLLRALICAGRHDEAAALLDTRLDRRPSPHDRTRRTALTRTASSAVTSR
jgi:uncharacterized NAD(P)/FAD-binding protein YdhS